jgi:HD-GYP domain-containing protein (c-di-GMP phosphodiesterase class II)
VAKAVGWAEERVRLLREAALVHDVGKVGVPEAVLLKGGPLTPDEYDQVKLHAELGARIADEVLTPDQATWIRHHHERPDGRGYPRGLTAAELPEGACLLAIADAWDCMTLGRSYSEPKSLDESLDECRRLVGLQFTQTAVDALLRVHDAAVTV